jgi:RecJ-like exonuclease
MTLTFAEELALEVARVGQQIDALTAAKPCRVCNGVGQVRYDGPVPGSLPTYEDCPYCEGSGLAVCSYCGRPITDEGEAWYTPYGRIVCLTCSCNGRGDEYDPPLPPDNGDEPPF